MCLFRWRSVIAVQVDLSGGAELRAILRIRPFRRLWLVLSLSTLGDWLGLFATATFAADQVSSQTGQGIAFSAVIAVRLLPALVFGPIAGVLADRFDRRLTMVVCDVLRFLLYASIPTVGVLADNAAISVGWATIAIFLIETVSMIWTPAKEASVPNLLPKARLELANQLTLISTYGIAPILATVILTALTSFLTGTRAWTSPSNVALYFNALTFLAAALTVFFGIKEISGHGGKAAAKGQGILTQFLDGWRYVAATPLARGLVLGILGAFAGGGVIIGVGKFYAGSLGGGDSTFYILVGVLFAGLGVGIAFGPRIVGALSRKRWFGSSIVFAGFAVILMALAPHLTIAVLASLLVGVGAGMAFLSGTTLLGLEISDEVRGRVFAFVWTAVRVVLMLTISVSAPLAGFAKFPTWHFAGVDFTLSSSRLLLALAGAVSVVTGLSALRQMDDRKGIPLVADIWGSMRGRPLSLAEPAVGPGRFFVFEGGEGAGKSTQAAKLAGWLRTQGQDPLITREPGATDVGVRIRGLVLDGRDHLAPKAEALLYAADRAQHVATVIRPALAAGQVVISDRYVDSSLAYQGAGRTMPVEEITWLSAWATSSLKPDLVILLDVEPAVGLKRASARGAADRIEAESLAFHERVRYAFLDLATAEPQRYLVLDATADADELAEKIRARVEPLLPAVQRV